MGLHVAIIPDGNRRWARSQGLPPTQGHKVGSGVLEPLLQTILSLKIDWLTIWGSSIDNLTKRSRGEVAVLNRLFATELRRLSESEAIARHDIRVRVLGAWETHLTQEAQESVRAIVGATKGNAGPSFTILLAYDGVYEMLQAIKRIAKGAGANTEITRELVKQNLETQDLPDVDILIRTGGEPHSSAGFLMWETADTHLFFPEMLWPEFTAKDLAEAVKEFNSRTRRFGT